MTRACFVVGAVALAAASAACTSAPTVPAPTTRSGGAAWLAVSDPEGNSAGIAMPGVAAGEPWVYDLGYPLCTTGGAVHVRGVEPFRPSGSVSVRDWSMGAPAGTLGRPGSAAEALGRLQHPAVTWPCTAADVRHLGTVTVTVVLHSSKAQANGFEVRSDHGSVVVPFVVTACAAATCDRDRGGP